MISSQKYYFNQWVWQRDYNYRKDIVGSLILFWAHVEVFFFLLRPIDSIVFFKNFKMYYFLDLLNLFSECWCNGLLKCRPSLFLISKTNLGVKIHLGPNCLTPCTVVHPPPPPLASAMSANTNLWLLHEPYIFLKTRWYRPFPIQLNMITLLCCCCCWYFNLHRPINIIPGAQWWIFVSSWSNYPKSLRDAKS